MDPKNKIRADIFTLIFVVYVLCITLSDVLDFGLYCLNLNRFLWLTATLSAVAVLTAAFFLRKRIELIPIKPDALFVVFSLGIMVLAFFKGIVPDTSYDVGYYHIYRQYPGFVDNVNNDVFVGTFLFPLADRLFYYPRMLLGYRMGTLFNGYLMVTIFAQIRNIIRLATGSKLSELHASWAKKSIFNPLRSLGRLLVSESLFAFLAITTFYAIANLGTYLVDLTALPLLLAFLVLQADGERKASGAEFIYAALLCGLSFAMKFTNAFFIAPMLIVYILQNRKSLKVSTFFLSLLTAVIPFTPYLIYNYLSIGNPFGFTFLTQIFKSPYLPSVAENDMRWGPLSHKQMLMWPIKLITDPTTHISEISKYPQIYILVGCIATAVLFIGCVICAIRRKKVHGGDLFMSLVYTFGMYLWLEVSGYPRYAIFLEILAVIEVSVLMIRFISAARFKIPLSILSFLIVLVLSAQCWVNTYNGAMNNYDWSWRGETGSAEYKSNFQYIFRDRGLIGTDDQRDRIDVFFSSNMLHEYCKLIDPSAKIVNYWYFEKYFPTLPARDFRTYYMNRINEDAAEGKGIYDVYLSNGYNLIADTANRMGATVKSVEYVEGNGFRALLVGYDFSGGTNTLADLYQTPQTFTVDASQTKTVKISGIAFIAPFVYWETPVTHFTVKATDGVNTAVLLDQEIQPRTFYNIDEELDLSAFTGPVTIKVIDETPTDWHTNAINVSVG
jgi:hypothetical protein